MYKFWLVLFALLTSSSAIADGKVIFGIEVGSSKFNIDEGIVEQISQDEIDDTGMSVSYSAGYKWSNNLIVEGSVNYSGNIFLNWGLSDLYETSELKALVGLAIPVAEHFRIVPMVGVSRWSTELRESAFLNPGPEERREYDDYDLSVKLTAEFPMRRGFILSLAYANTQSNIGDMQSTMFGFKYEF